jgi:RNA polymerase sigma-70 factor (ECF subfamily)
VKNKDDALDIVQESVYKAYISYHEVKEIRYENTWLVRILINTSIDFLKKKSRVVALDMSYVENMRDSKSENIHTKVIVEEALDKLNEKQKTVVILRYFEDMKLEDIASILDAPVSTVKTILYKAIKDMKVNLEE